MKAKRFAVKRQKLGKLKAWGLSYSDEKTLYIDERLRCKKELEIIIHEALHLLFPDLSEEKTIEKSVILTNTLWHQHYRKIDNSTDLPMQDGGK